MRNLFLVLVVSIFSFPFSCLGKASTIFGVEPTFAGKKLYLSNYLDEIVGMSRILDSCTVDSDGNFKLKMDYASPMLVFIPSETFNGFIFVEPGKNYKVKIPAFTERSLAQKLDPYYKPMDLFLQIEDLQQNDFNYKIMEFDDAFDFYSMKQVVMKSGVDSINSYIDQMKELFNDFYSNKYLSRYMEYRFLLLLNSSSQVVQDSLVGRLNNMGVDEQNPAFWDLFNNLFNDFIVQTEYDREQYLSFQRVVEEGNVKMYFMLITKRYGITDVALRELVAIKWLYDLINQSQFDQFKVLDLLQKIGSGISFQQNRDLLTYVLNNTIVNIIGSPAPDFVMKSIDGKEKNLKDFKGKYIYLNFENSVIDQTQKDLEVLLRFQNNFGNDLVVLNVGLYDDPRLVESLSHRFHGKMKFYLAKDSDFLKKLYNISSIPSFFLIDKDGNFLMTKGAEPTDELRVLLQKILKSN